MAIKTTSKAKRLVRNFQQATDTFASKGSQHPDDWPYIDAAFKKAKAALDTYISDLEFEVKALAEQIDLKKRIDRVVDTKPAGKAPRVNPF